MTKPVSQPTGTEPTDTAGRVRELGHIVLYVADLDRSLAFYRDILGWPVIAAAQGSSMAGFRAGNTHHDLVLVQVGTDAQPVPVGKRLGMYHFAVKVGDSDDDLRAVLARLQARPDLTTVARAVDSDFIHSLYVHDPDGNEVELYIDVPGYDWNDPNLFTNVGRKPLEL